MFDEATQARQEALEDLLSGVGSARATPPLFAGWSARLALEMPDPICLFPAVPGSSRSATGLFTLTAQSLAVVVGETLYPFGDPSCGERLTAFLSEPNPLDLAKLEITAAPHNSLGALTDESQRLIREHFDLAVNETHPGDRGEA